MANLITVLRFPLMIILVLLLATGGSLTVFWCIPLFIVIALMDTLDGYVARKRGETSLLGSALDIAADRTLEMLLWVVFAYDGLISLAIPVIVIMRGVLVDAIRAVGIGEGIPPFKQVIFPISRFLVSSPVVRTLYGLFKGAAFTALTLDLGLQKLNNPWGGWVHVVALTLTWLAVALCILRGVPVLVDGAITLNKAQANGKSSSLD